MYIIAVCGPCNAVLQEFVKRLLQDITEKSVQNYSYTTEEEFLHTMHRIKKGPAIPDALIFTGQTLFSNKEIRELPEGSGVKIFMATDDDECLKIHLESTPFSPEFFPQVSETYFTTIKPLQEEARKSSKYANFVIPRHAKYDPMFKLIRTGIDESSIESAPRLAVHRGRTTTV